MSLWTVREISEIEHALHYATQLNHGTAGHNQLMLIAKMADALGFTYGPDGLDIGDNEIVAAVELTNGVNTVRTGGEEVREIY